MSDSGFRVAGVLDNTLYEVEVTGRADDPVVGSKRVRGLLRQFEGEDVAVTPQGPTYTVDPRSPASILALLSVHTKVTRVSDDAPRLVDPRPEGAVY